MNDNFKFCVYRHKIGKNIFYVGAGNLERPYNFGRNEKWKEIVESNNNEYEVEIVCYTKTKQEALNIEKELQKVYWEFGMCQACLNTSESFEKSASKQRGVKRGKSPQCKNKNIKRRSKNGNAKTITVINTETENSKVYGSIWDAVDDLKTEGATYKMIYSRLRNGKLLFNKFKILEGNVNG